MIFKYKRDIKPFQQLLTQINIHRSGLETVPDNHLKEMSAALINRARTGVPLDDLLIEAFSLACETSRRVLNMRPFDVQIIAAIAMHQGNLAEMQTGEGKTLAAVLPVYLNALSGKGVHVLTFNDYLARRDAGWMGPIYRFLGLSTAFVQEGMNIAERQNAYAADITYLTAREAGFDFLRDLRCMRKQDLVHRPFHFAVIDEADSILIDEARIPLVIAGDMPVTRADPHELAKLIRSLDKRNDYYFDEYSRDVNFSDTGLDRLENILGCGNLHDLENNQLLSALNLALQAELLLHRDIDYIVRDGKVELVDEFTGRTADKRRWPYGLQTAIEAKEGLELSTEGTILGSITLQHFLKLYPKIAGMTATAKTSEEELAAFYDLKVVVIPPNRPCIRIDHPDVVFTHKVPKFKALIREIVQVHASGRPILVGTASVEESEYLALLLLEAGVNCNVLNAKNDEAEAAVVAEAGALNAVTISTNMAGRGTDIRLGGRNQETYNETAALGGLYVIGTNRHESRRIDDQLRGRAGRQGDPGSSRFFISMEDDLMVRYRLSELIPPKYLPSRQDAAIDNKVVAREIARAQRIVEGQNFEIRKTLRQYSFMVEEQRKILHNRRNDVLTDREPLTLAASAEPERYSQLLLSVSAEVLKQVEKEITLFHIDSCWTEHLAYVTHVREGIHLMGFCGKSPTFEFQKMIIKAFDEMLRTIDERITDTFRNAVITENGIDAEREGLIVPSSTWTYLIDDNPFGNRQLRGALVGSTAFAFHAAPWLMLLSPFILARRRKASRTSKNL